MNYHNKKFKAVSISENGEVSTDMIFEYQQNGDILTCNYQGKNISSGHLLGIVDKEGTIQMSYHQVNHTGEIMTGVCESKPEIMENGKIRLHEKWRWTSGDQSSGTSILEEL